VEEKIKISESGKMSFRQEVVRKAMGAYKRNEKFTLDSHAQLHERHRSSTSLFEAAPRRAAAGELPPPAPTMKRGRRYRWWKSAWSTSTATITTTAPARRLTT